MYIRLEKTVNSQNVNLERNGRVVKFNLFIRKNNNF